mgnify:CR=1 FL=1
MNRKTKYEIIDNDWMARYYKLGWAIQHKNHKMGIDARPIAKRYKLRLYTFVSRFGGVQEGLIMNAQETPEMMGRIICLCAEYFGTVPQKWIDKYIVPVGMRYYIAAIVGINQFRLLFPEYPVEPPGSLEIDQKGDNECKANTNSDNVPESAG